jgi:3-dehydroquinate synthase
VHVLTDSIVAGYHLTQVTSVAAASGFEVSVHMLPAGEGAKSFSTLSAIWHEMHASGVDRRTLVVALGGGAVCDAATLAAATYMRGLPYALVPTTLIAQADAAIGGKGGADFEGVKNLVGTFYHPAAVVVDPGLLRTLDRRHIGYGMAEIIKVAVIHDRGLLDLVESGAARSLDGLDAVIRQAIRCKLELLASDPFERDSLARALNFGHCVGHAAEAASGFTIHHGEAVAVGIATAAAIGVGLGHCGVAAMERIARVLDSNGLPVILPAQLRSRTWKGMSEIRRVRNGPLNLVVPAGIGTFSIIPDISEAMFWRALGTMDRWKATQPCARPEDHDAIARL